MSALSDEWLDRAAALVDSEMNDGVLEQPEVEPAGAPDGDTPELTIDERGRAHDPTTGQFVAQSDDEAPEVQEAPETQEEPSESLPEAPEEEVKEEVDELVYEIDDPEILELLDKYDGDVVKALKAAREAQSLIGRQGSELGEVRQQLNQLMEMAQSQQQFDPRMYAPYQSDIEENPEALAYEAFERGDGQTLHQALRAWGEIDPFNAAIFVSAMPQLLAQAEAQEPAYEQGASIDAEFAALKARHPDVDKHLQGIVSVLQERPHLNAAVAQGDPQARARAFEDAYLLARSQSPDSDTSAAVRKVVLRQRAEADQAKDDAAVVSASKTSAAETAPTGDRLLEEAIRSISGLDDFKVVG